MGRYCQLTHATAPWPGACRGCSVLAELRCNNQEFVLKVVLADAYQFLVWPRHSLCYSMFWVAAGHRCQHITHCVWIVNDKRDRYAWVGLRWGS